MTARAMFYFKLAASLVLLAVIINSADWSAVWVNLQQLDPLLAASAFVILLIIVILSAWKWWWLLRIHNAPFPFPDLNRWYFIALFFNNFLPTSIGGDGFRLYRTFQNNRSRSTAVVAIFVERVSGILSLLGLGWLASIASYANSGNPFAGTVMYAGLAFLVVSSVLLVIAWLMKLYTRVLDWPRLPAILHHVLTHLSDYARDINGSLVVLILSILFHTLNISGLWLLTQAIGAQISIVDLTIVVAMVNVVSLLPLSINGVGLVDGAFIYLLGLFGVDYAHGLSFSIMLRFLVLPLSAIGMVLYLKDKRADGSAPAHSPVSQDT